MTFAENQDSPPPNPISEGEFLGFKVVFYECPGPQNTRKRKAHSYPLRILKTITPSKIDICPTHNELSTLVE